MTAIVALEHKGKVWMGCDSAGSRDWDLRLRSEDDCKIIERDGWLIGVSGVSRWLSLLKSKFAPPVAEAVPTAYEETYALVSAAVESMYQLAKQYDLVNDDKMIDAAMLIAYRGAVWIVDAGFGLVHHSYPFAAIGCGDQVALGTLYGLQNAPEPYEPADAEYVITTALEAAEQFSAGVRAPFVIRSV